MANRVYIREGKNAIPAKPVKSPTAAYVLYYHITFRTKWSRETFAGDETAERLASILMDICSEKGFDLFGVAVMPDHVHVVVSLPPTVAPATAVKYLKGISSRLYHKGTGEAGSLWSDGYSATAVGTKNIWQTLSYLASQDVHHGLIPG
jgi:putative transposase